MNSRKDNVNRIWITIRKIRNLSHRYNLIIELDFFRKEIFASSYRQKVITGFSQDIVIIDKEDEVALSLLIFFKNETGHEKSLARSCRHIKEDMLWG